MHAPVRYLAVALALSVASCGGRQSAEALWDQAEDHVAARRYERAIRALNTLVKRYPEDALASRAQFRIGDVYLNNARDIPAALEALRETSERYPNTEDGPKALFMVGFVYANHVGDSSSATSAYLKFLEHYPNHELIPSVKFELENMGKPVEDIDVLRDVVNAS